ncbi:MAG TPA: hypothetical protein PLH49_13735, partial [Chitinophagaceae bacterium]|nr:hypothetical protein [Chitinophagaceae bacterium]
PLGVFFIPNGTHHKVIKKTYGYFGIRTHIRYSSNWLLSCYLSFVPFAFVLSTFPLVGASFLQTSVRFLLLP